jgi:DNA-binding response OmpR family regulator
MPKLNGFETLSRLKHHSFWQSVPVVMMTNLDQAELLQGRSHNKNQAVILFR